VRLVHTDEIMLALRPAVVEEPPAFLRLLNPAEIESGDQHFLFGTRGTRNDFAEWVRNEGTAPKSQITLAADPIHGCGENAIQRCMGAHRVLPAMCRERLISFEFLEPTNRGRIKNDLRSLNRVDACRFRIPLVITNKRCDYSSAGFDLNVADVTGRKVMLLVIVGVVRNVHFSIFARQGSIAVRNEGGVVVLTIITLLQYRPADQQHMIRCGTLRKET